MFERSRVLVTGGAGSLGSFICERLLDVGRNGLAWAIAHVESRLIDRPPARFKPTGQGRWKLPA